jgi:hypothetical protein
MSTRTSSAALLLLLLAACDAGPSDEVGPANVQVPAEPTRAAEPRIHCAASAEEQLEPVCVLEEVRTPEGSYLTLRHPDGAFRRLFVASDGRGVIAADGAEQAVVTPLGSAEIEVALAGARYRLPATVASRESSAR